MCKRSAMNKVRGVLNKSKKSTTSALVHALNEARVGKEGVLNEAQVHKIVALIRAAMVLVRLDQNMFLFWVILKEQGVHLS